MTLTCCVEQVSRLERALICKEGRQTTRVHINVNIRVDRPRALYPPQLAQHRPSAVALLKHTI